MKYSIAKVSFNPEAVKKQTKEQFIESQPHLSEGGIDLSAEYDTIVGVKPNAKKQLNEGNDKRPVE